MLARDQFDFDDIVCPNSFEDDPGLDAFFNQRSQLRKREVSKGDVRTFKSCKSTVRVRTVVKGETTKSFIQRRIHGNSCGPNLKRKQKKPTPVDYLKAGAEERVTPIAQMIIKVAVEPQRKRRIGSRFRKQQDESIPGKDCIQRHIWGRWSLPTAKALTQSVDPEEVKVAQVTPLRSKKVIKTMAEKGNSCTAVTTNPEDIILQGTRLRMRPRGQQNFLYNARTSSYRPAPYEAESEARTLPERHLSDEDRTSWEQELRLRDADIRNRVGVPLLPHPPKKSQLKTTPSNPVKPARINEKRTGNRPSTFDNVGKTLAQLVSEFQTCLRQYSSNSRVKGWRPVWRS